MTMPRLVPLLALALLLPAMPSVGAGPLPGGCESQDLGMLIVDACMGPTICEQVGQASFFVRVCIDTRDCPTVGSTTTPPEVCTPADRDDDGDGWTVGQGDCDDANPSTYPGAFEHPDGVDNDCDGTVDEGIDWDGDGWTSEDGDCDDWDPSTHPGAPERPGDGIDNDCDGMVDEA